MTNKNMIPKIIHYCWFGNNPLPPVVKLCMDSWEKYCPDYQIIEWNESNFDVFDCPYSAQAYEAKMWAFVSDYARIKILYEHGGIYMDTDVELLKNIDPLLNDRAFMGFETKLVVNSGLIAGSEAKLPILSELIEEYQHYIFKREDGSLNLTSCVEYQTALLQRHGLVKENRIQNVGGLKIYPIAYFSPLNHYTGAVNIREETYSIHRYEGTWVSETTRYGYKLKWKYMNKYGVLLGKVIYVIPYIAYIISHEGIKELFNKIRNKFN